MDGHLCTLSCNWLQIGYSDVPSILIRFVCAVPSIECDYEDGMAVTTM